EGDVSPFMAGTGPSEDPGDGGAADRSDDGESVAAHTIVQDRSTVLAMDVPAEGNVGESEALGLGHDIDGDGDGAGAGVATVVSAGRVARSAGGAQWAEWASGARTTMVW